MRAQIGIEIIGVVGFAFIILIPLFTGFYFYSNNYWERLGIEKADAAAGRLASAVDMVGVQGDGTLTQEIVIPDNVEKIEIRGNEVIFFLSTSFGTTEIVKTTSHEASSTFASLRAGSYMVKAEARKGKVTLGLE
jgi:hypothetical protein